MRTKQPHRAIWAGAIGDETRAQLQVESTTDAGSAKVQSPRVWVGDSRAT
jgi:hypothetical protein